MLACRDLNISGSYAADGNVMVYIRIILYMTVRVHMSGHGVAQRLCVEDILRRADGLPCRLQGRRSMDGADIGRWTRDMP